MIKRRRHAAAAACATTLLALGAAGPAGAAPAPSTTERVTLTGTGAQLALGGDVLALSGDGCLTLIGERHDGIGPGDDNDAFDAFVRDCETGSVEHVSVDANGDPLPFGAGSASMSADGRYVAFVAQQSEWSSLGSLYVRDRVTDTTRAIEFGPWGDDWPWGYDLVAAIDPTGRYVAATYHGYLIRFDLQEESATYIPAGRVEFTMFSMPISSDGDIVFSSRYALAPEDTDEDADVYVADRSSGTLSLLGAASSGAVPADGWYPSISANGRYVAFPGTTHPAGGLAAWLVDRQDGTVVRVDRTHDGSPPDGPAQIAAGVSDTCDVVYESLAENIVPTEGNPDSATGDVYVWDCAADETVLASVSTGGVQGNGFSTAPLITPDGRHVGFASDASNLVTDDTNGTWDGFVRHLPADGG